MKTKSFLLASAAASLFIVGGTGVAGAAHHEEAEAKIKCEGANSCKGHSECKTAENECSGQNSCKGKGYMNLTKAECEAATTEARKLMTNSRESNN